MNSQYLSFGNSQSRKACIVTTLRGCFMEGKIFRVVGVLNQHLSTFQELYAYSIGSDILQNIKYLLIMCFLPPLPATPLVFWNQRTVARVMGKIEEQIT